MHAVPQRSRMYFVKVGKEIWWPTSSNLLAPWKTAAKLGGSWKLPHCGLKELGEQQMQLKSSKYLILNNYDRDFQGSKRVTGQASGFLMEDGTIEGQMKLKCWNSMCKSPVWLKLPDKFKTHHLGSYCLPSPQAKYSTPRWYSQGKVLPGVSEHRSLALRERKG